MRDDSLNGRLAEEIAMAAQVPALVAGSPILSTILGRWPRSLCLTAGYQTEP